MYFYEVLNVELDFMSMMQWRMDMEDLESFLLEVLDWPM
jgi:hypothetical protein